MSTYKAITLHPLTGMPEVATWHDDYYGKHKYAVEFLSDGKIFPAESCKQIKVSTYKTPAGKIKSVWDITAEEESRIISKIMFELQKSINETPNE